MRIVDIERAIEERSVKPELEECVRVLLQSVNDWPTEIKSTEHFIQELGSSVHGELDEASIRARLSKIDFATKAWLAESLDELTEIFAFFPKGESIIQILKLIEDDLGKSC